MIFLLRNLDNKLSLNQVPPRQIYLNVSQTSTKQKSRSKETVDLPIQAETRATCINSNQSKLRTCPCDMKRGCQIKQKNPIT